MSDEKSLKELRDKALEILPKRDLRGGSLEAKGSENKERIEDLKERNEHQKA
jgi:hypothetical protein